MKSASANFWRGKKPFIARNFEVSWVHNPLRQRFESLRFLPYVEPVPENLFGSREVFAFQEGSVAALFSFQARPMTAFADVDPGLALELPGDPLVGILPFLDARAEMEASSKEERQKI